MGHELSQVVSSCLIIHYLANRFHHLLTTELIPVPIQALSDTPRLAHAAMMGKNARYGIPDLTSGMEQGLNGLCYRNEEAWHGDTWWSGRLMRNHLRRTGVDRFRCFLGHNGNVMGI